MSQPVNDDAIDFFEIDQDITLRRMVLRNSNPKGTVLFLHGFPETLYAWKDIAKALADEYEVHAFDWPGYGLSSRPTVDRFSYAPKDYARILDRYFGKAGIDTSKLTIYATDIGALPTLLLAVERPDIARTIIVGDFAPFNRPQFMYASLQSLKEGPAMDQVRANLNSDRDEILQNTFTRGLPEEEHFEVAREFKDDMFRGWTQGAMTSADAFSHYYSHFTRDQDHFESQLARLKTPVKYIWLLLSFMHKMKNYPKTFVAEDLAFHALRENLAIFYQNVRVRVKLISWECVRPFTGGVFPHSDLGPGSARALLF
jgi:pimeloyl-ACP methyl ester carboxylesterase